MHYLSLLMYIKCVLLKLYCYNHFFSFNFSYTCVKKNALYINIQLLICSFIKYLKNFTNIWINICCCRILNINTNKRIHEYGTWKTDWNAHPFNRYFCYLHCITNAIHFACEHVKSKNIYSIYNITHLPYIIKLLWTWTNCDCITHIKWPKSCRWHVEVTRNLLQINIHQIFKWIDVSICFIHISWRIMSCN